MTDSEGPQLRPNAVAESPLPAASKSESLKYHECIDSDGHCHLPDTEETTHSSKRCLSYKQKEKRLPYHDQEPRLGNQDEVAYFLRVSYILKYYRLHYTESDALLSLFQMHNETSLFSPFQLRNNLYQ